MSAEKPEQNYILGIDVGVASLGLARLKLDPAGKPVDILGGSVLTYPIPFGAAERRLKRSARKTNDQKGRRLDRLSDLLAQHGIGYERGKEPKDLLELSPIKLRAKASREKIELAEFSRALFHMAKHRGSSAFREADIKRIENDETGPKDEKDGKGKEEKENRATAVGINALRAAMKAKNFKTYGQFLRWREKSNLPTRINAAKIANAKGDYAFYPSRELLQEEFNIIWDKQAEFHPDHVTDELKAAIANELFFQRAVTAPPPGKCPYYLEEDRLPRASRLFQERRIYEEVNSLKFTDKNGYALPYALEDRDKLVAVLMAGENLTFATIKSTLGLDRSTKLSLENSQARDGIKGYPLDLALGGAEALGTVWQNKSASDQDAVLRILATVHNDEKATAALHPLLNADRNLVTKALSTSLPKGWGRIGETATIKLLEQLKTKLIPAKKAEMEAGLVHAISPDGVVHDTLPYYGEILLGHTVPPMWVSDYRRDTDVAPHTNKLEEKFGRIPNPVVHLALNQIRKAINATIKKHGLPKAIHIELARELNKSAEARDEIAKQNEKNRKANNLIASRLEENNVTVSRANIQRYKLWEEQKNLCLYTGRTIAFGDLFGGTVDVDHILPRSQTFSDGLANKCVCLSSANKDKGNRAPFDAFSDREDYDWEGIMRRVADLPDNKQWRFSSNAMERFLQDPDFRARYGTDNSYLARVTRLYLTSLYGEPKHVVAVSSHIVSLLRGKWGLQNILGNKENGRKARDDHRHHFVDALVTACATRSTIQAIQTEAARTERAGLESFVENIAPPFGEPKDFYTLAKDVTHNKVSGARKADHSTAGQLHEDTLLGIVDGPDKKGAYVCRKRKTLDEYQSFAALEKPKIQNTLPDLPEIEEAREDLDNLKETIRSLMSEAEEELRAEQVADIAAGKKGKTNSPAAIYRRAIALHKAANGKTSFTLYEKQKLVNIQTSPGNNRPTGGFVSGRNHRKDFYTDANGKLAWQCISMLDANDPGFKPNASLPGHTLLWSAHKDDVIEMDDPENPVQRRRYVVAKMDKPKMGVIPEFDARPANERQLYEQGLSFFQNAGARRLTLNEIGDVKWAFPALPRSGLAPPDEA
ncbi:MAG: type II CRISPR RNA-guided endonuclease Cas9 [Parvibaculum sp.]